MPCHVCMGPTHCSERKPGRLLHTGDFLIWSSQWMAAPPAGFPRFTQWQMTGQVKSGFKHTHPLQSGKPGNKQTKQKTGNTTCMVDGGQELCPSFGGNILSMLSMFYYLFGRQLFIFNLVIPLDGGAAIVLSMVSPCVKCFAPFHKNQEGWSRSSHLTRLYNTTKKTLISSPNNDSWCWRLPQWIVFDVWWCLTVPYCVLIWEWCLLF